MHRLFVFVLLLALAGCRGESSVDDMSDVDVSSVKLERVVEDALANPHSIELFSLDPRDIEAGDEQFHRWKVLGHATLDADEEMKILNAFKAGVKLEGNPPACFEPRHALRIRSNSKTVDIAICFSCCQYQLFDGEAIPGFPLISNRPRGMFDKVLKDNGVPLCQN